MAQEKPGQTLQATALVHEAYIRLVDTEKAQHWDSRGHFFTAAAEAMRRILVERARRKRPATEDGLPEDRASDLVFDVADCRAGEVVAVDEALEELQRHDPEAAELVKLRFFAGTFAPGSRAKPWGSVVGKLTGFGSWPGLGSTARSPEQ